MSLPHLNVKDYKWPLNNSRPQSPLTISINMYTCKPLHEICIPPVERGYLLLPRTIPQWNNLQIVNIDNITLIEQSQATLNL